MLPLKFHRLFHGLPPLVPPYYANYTPTFICSSSDIDLPWHTLIHLGGETWLAKEATLDQRPCVREPGYLVENSCPLLSLPLTPAWQQPEIWGLPRPLSWGKRTGQHTYTQNSFCLCSLSLSLAHPGLQRRKKAVCLCSFTHSVTNRNHRFTYTLPLPSSQNH